MFSSAPRRLRPALLFAVFSLAALPLRVQSDPTAPIDPSRFKAPVRVACLGDSITFGVGAGSGQAWPSQLERMLGDQWDVRNFGHSGATVSKGDKNSIWSQKVYADALLFHPDVAIILLGTNDSKPENWSAKEQFPKLYQELVRSFANLSSHPSVFCGTAPYVAKKGNFGINEAGVLEQIPMLQQIARDHQAGLIDIHAATLGHDEWYKDNVHPSAAGATAIAAAVYRALMGKEWTGEVPPPAHDPVLKPTLRTNDNPGEIAYKDLFAMIASETTMTRDEMQPVRELYERNAPVVAAKIQEWQDKIAEYERLRMTYKHTANEAEKPLYSEFKSKGAEAQKELARYKLQQNMALIAAIPSAHKAEFGTAWLALYVTDRLTPISSSITPEQRVAIHALCAPRGATYAGITNTPERSIMEAEVYQETYAHVLDPEQKKRVEPK